MLNYNNNDLSHVQSTLTASGTDHLNGAPISAKTLDNIKLNRTLDPILTKNAYAINDIAAAAAQIIKMVLI